MQKILASIMMMIPLSAYAQMTVPFQNYFMAPQQIITADYTIGNHREIFCLATNTQIVGLITWPYNGTRPQSTLPVLLKTDSIFEGEFADNSGTITIQNTTSSQLSVSCLFGF